MAKHLAFEQIFRNGGAVHGHPRLVPAGGVTVDRARNHLLARAGFAIDQHGCRRGRDLLDGVAHRHHGGRMGDQTIKTRLNRCCLTRVHRRTSRAVPLLLRPFQAGHHVIDLERFRKIVENAAFHRLDRRLNRCVGRKKDDRHIGGDVLDLLEKRHAVHRRHPEIGDGDVNLPLPDDIKRRRAIARTLNFIAICLQKALKQQKNAWLVVNDKNS